MISADSGLSGNTPNITVFPSLDQLGSRSLSPDESWSGLPALARMGGDAMRMNFLPRPIALAFADFLSRVRIFTGPVGLAGEVVHSKVRSQRALASTMTELN
jgi:hypothetical protein